MRFFFSFAASFLLLNLVSLGEIRNASDNGAGRTICQAMQRDDEAFFFSCQTTGKLGENRRLLDGVVLDPRPGNNLALPYTYV